MKKVLLPLLMFALMVASCVDYKSQIELLQNEIDQISKNLDDIELIASGLGGLRNALTVASAGDPALSVSKSADGYVFEFKNSGTVKVLNQTAGVSLGEQDGKYYWTLGGQWLNGAGNSKVEMSVTPKFRSNKGIIEMSVDGGASWAQVSLSSEPVISKITEDAAYFYVTLMGGTEVALAKDLPKLAVSYSGDGSTMESEGRVRVDYYIKGISDDYVITPVVADGWRVNVIPENHHKGTIEIEAPANDRTSDVTMLVSDGFGNMISTTFDFKTLSVDGDFPVMYPATEAYGVSYQGGSVDVVLNTNLDYEYELSADATWLKAAGSKALRQETVSFNAEPNDAPAMRSATLTFTSDDYVKTVAIYQDGRPVESAGDLSAGGTANCYIVTKEGDYFFDALVAGNGNDGIVPSVTMPASDFPATAELATAFVEIGMNQGDVISDVSLLDGKIHFHANGAKGNATIIARNVRKLVIWSWHIWCTDRPMDRTHTNPDYLQFTVLDRNLGATSAVPTDAGTCGLFYQWGRKDPFEEAKMSSPVQPISPRFVVPSRDPLNPYKGGGYTNWYDGINDFLWGNPYYQKNRHLKDIQKSIYDPCPAGYMVAPANTFLIFGDESRIKYLDEGIIIRDDYGQDNFFPWAGRAFENVRTIGSELALWHSTAARYDVLEDAGGAMTRVLKEDHSAYWYYGNPRAHGAQVRCVKQVNQ